MRRSLLKRWLRAALNGLIVGGLALAALPLAQAYYGAHSQDTLRDEWRAARRAAQVEAKSAHTSALKNRATKNRTKGKVPRPSLPTLTRWTPTRLVIPDINLDEVVVRGISVAALRRGPGHDPTSALPGQSGNCVIAGHRNAWGWCFYRLNQLGDGSLVQLLTPRQSFTYRVALLRVVSETDMSLLRARNGKRLVLYTCALPHGSHRIVVVANLIRAQAAF